jgi:predicted phosphodiesterase
MDEPLFAAIFGDTHFPWHHRDALFRALDLLNPEMNLVVQVGDLYDYYSFSRFRRSHYVASPHEELFHGRQLAEWFWAEVKARCPRARCIQLLGNHDDRAVNKVLDAAPELQALSEPTIRGMHLFPGVETVGDSTTGFDVGGIAFHHGYLSGPTDHARAVLKPVVHGHTHKLRLNWVRPGLWEMDVGYLGDENAPVFGYAAWKQATPMCRGMGIIDQYGPRVVPL